MKIAQVCPYDFSRPGGVKNHIESLSKYLRLAGHDVKIIAPAPDVSVENVYHFGRNRSLNIGGTKIDLNIALNDERRALKRFLKEEDFDIIHFHTFWNPALPLQIRRYSKAKHVATFHDTPKSELIGKTLMPLAAKGVFQLMDAVISVSQSQAKYINRFSSKHISIIPNGIDLDQYQLPIEPMSLFKDDFINLLFLGRLEPRKGLTYALESFKSLKSKFPKLRLLIAGDGDERALAVNFIQENQLQDVELLGFVSEHEKLQLLKTADIYLAPSIYGESFGIVLLEAMAMGTPIAGFANQGYLNVLSESQKAFFATPKMQTEFTSKLESLIIENQKRTELSDNGKEIVKKYDWKIVSQDILAIYKQIMNQ